MGNFPPELIPAQGSPSEAIVQPTPEEAASSSQQPSSTQPTSSNLELWIPLTAQCLYDMLQTPVPLEVVQEKACLGQGMPLLWKDAESVSRDENLNRLEVVG